MQTQIFCSSRKLYGQDAGTFLNTAAVLTSGTGNFAKIQNIVYEQLRDERKKDAGILDLFFSFHSVKFFKQGRYRHAAGPAVIKCQICCSTILESCFFEKHSST